MKQFKLFFAVTALLVGWIAASSQTVAPYTVDFNTAINTSTHNFKVAPGWEHVVSSYSTDYYDVFYPTYTYVADAGVNGTGALLCGDQTSVGEGWDSGPTTDLLVTPAITGTSSIWVKKAKTSGTVKFYTVTKSGTTYSKGSEITVTLPTLSETDFVEVAVPAQEGAYVGIYGSNVYIDDFKAASVEITLTKALTVSNIARNDGMNGEKINCAANGDFTVALSAQITNTGEVAFNPGDADYSVNMINYNNNNEVLGTFPINIALGVGESATIELSAVMNYNNTLSTSSYNPKRFRVDVSENVGKSSAFGLWLEAVPFIPMLEVRNDDGTVKSGTAVSFGMVNQNVSKTFYLSNSGAAPLNITTITLPAGFSISKQAPLTIEAGGKDTIDVTLNADAPGVYSGNLVLKSEGLDDFTLALSGTVLDANKFYEPFTAITPEGAIPGGWLDESFGNWKTTSWTAQEANNVAYSSNVNMVKLITPLLKVTEGEKMTFDAAKTQFGYSSTSVSDQSNVKVYYSTDRENWTLAKEVSNDDLEGSAVSTSSSFYPQLFNNYVIEGIPAGNYYIAFESGFVVLDNVYGFERAQVDHDVILKSSTIPATGQVNKEYFAKAELINLNVQPEDSASYTATLFVDGQPVATAAPVAIAPQATREYVFAYTPHAEGTFDTYVTFDFGAFKLYGDTVAVTIAAESATNAYTVGEVKDTKSTFVPVSPNFNNSISETLYTQAQLEAAGLKKGDKIQSLTYRGYNSADDVTGKVKAFIYNCNDTEFGDPDMTQDDLMTKVFEKSYTFKKAGAFDDLVDMLVINFDEPFTYEGGALRIKVSNVNETTYKSVNFAVDNTVLEQCYGSRSDDTAVEDFTSFSSAYSMPVTTFGVVATPDTIRGKVIELVDGVSQPLAGVNIMLVSVIDATAGAPAKAPAKVAQIQYSGMTDENGEYAIPVIQVGPAYDATYSLSGYESQTIRYSTLGEVADVVLKKADVTGVTQVETQETVNSNIYSIDGRLVKKNADSLEGLERGVYIFRGKKVLVK